MTRSSAAKDKAARLARLRHAPVVDPEQHEHEQAPATSPAASEERARPARVRPVRVTLDLAPALHDEFDEWARRAESELRAAGVGRQVKAKALRVLLRKLLADEQLQREVIEAVRRDG